MRASARLTRWASAWTIVATTSVVAACRGPAFQLAGESSEGGGGADTGTGGAGGAPNALCEPSEGATPDASCGVFVVPGVADGDGSIDAPFGSVGAALAVSADRIYVCEGSLRETVALPPATRIYGGLDCAAWSFKLAGRTELVADPGEIPLVLLPGDGAHVEGLRVTAESAVVASQSSIALLADHATASITRVDLVAGNGEDGVDGQDANASVPGGDGGNGTSVGGQGGSSSCNRGGGDGGTGNVAGAPGAPAQGNGGSAGCTSGTTGVPGMSGPNGDDAPIGTLGNDGFSPGIATDGTAGSSGGGGGGGGGKTGTSGGGGGAGGCAGGAGTAGTSGGSSLAIVSLESNLTFFASTATVGFGGRGGSGGQGATAASGGQPGTGSSGCSGGPGGVAGSSGRGGGGHGGHAIVLAYLGADAPSVEGLDYSTPTADQAGAGGGIDGVAGVALDFD